MSLSRLGWDTRFEHDFREHFGPGLAPARIAREDRGRYLVADGAGEHFAEVTGRLRRTAVERGDLPVVGDWVAVGSGRIHGVLPRRSRFVRPAAGRSSREQVVAANVDVVFLVTGLDRDFSLRRIERYLTLAATSGATPVLVLGKADLSEDVDLSVRQVEGIAAGLPVLPVSAIDGTGIDRLRAWLGRGRTGALLGSSGVGKSTLVNCLSGAERLPTGEVRARDGRGRHTTTRRELILLPDEGGILIDTPGLREIGLTGGGEGLSSSFAEVEEIAARCRFRDCRHEGEPGCAVQEALGDGSIDVDRFESFLEQRRELAYQERRSDERKRRAEEERWRRIAIEQRRMKKRRRHER